MSWKNEYQEQHYKKNKAVYVNRAKKHNKIARSRNSKIVEEYRKQHPCIDCGEDNWIVLEFAHKSGTKKLGNVVDLASKPVSVKTLLAEIKKCNIRCANCHRIETYKKRRRIEQSG